MVSFSFLWLFIFMTEKYIRKLIREQLEQLNESRMVTYPTQILFQIPKAIPELKMLGQHTMGDGSTALYRYEFDGNAYEIQIRPASLSKNKSDWGKILAPKENPAKKMYRDLGFNDKK